MSELKKQLAKLSSWFVLAVGLIVVYKMFDNFDSVLGFLGNFFSIIAPFLAGILIAYLLYIPAKSIENGYKKAKFKIIQKKARPLSILTVYIIALILIIIAIKIIWPIVLDSVIELASNIQGYYNATIQRFNALPEDSILKSDIVKEFITGLQTIDITQYINLNDLTQYAKGILNVAGTIFDVFVAIIVSIYILAERAQILNFIKSLAASIFNKKAFRNLGKYFNSTNRIFFRFLSSQFLDAIVVGFLTTIAMAIMGVKYAPLLGFMIGLFNMIPYFGAIIAVIIASIITLITGGLSQAIWMIIIVVIIQQIDANIINPNILGNSLKISPLVVIIAVTLGGAYFGIIGMFLAVPIVAVLNILITDYVKYKNKKMQEEIEEEAWKEVNKEQK